MICNDRTDNDANNRLTTRQSVIFKADFTSAFIV